MVFGWSQIVMDIQPLLSMLGANIPLHGFSHTLIGASILGIVAIISGKYFSELGLSVLRMPTYIPIKWSTTMLSAFIGVYSHVALDSIMHSDVLPLSPFSLISPLYRVIDIDQLHILCLACGVIGGFAYFLYPFIRQNKSNY